MDPDLPGRVRAPTLAIRGALDTLLVRPNGARRASRLVLVRNLQSSVNANPKR